MKYVVYHAISPLGYPIDIWTDGQPGKVTYEDLFADEATRIMKIEKTGAKVVQHTATPTTPALNDTTQSQDKFCSICGQKMTYREGVSKAGKAYKGFFCSTDGHPPTWVK